MSEHAPGANPYRSTGSPGGSCSSSPWPCWPRRCSTCPAWFLVLFLLAFMMVKAVMIGGNFMHLRFERANLA